MRDSPGCRELAVGAGGQVVGHDVEPRSDAVGQTVLALVTVQLTLWYIVTKP